MSFASEKSQDTLGGKYVGAFAPTYLLGWLVYHNATGQTLTEPYAAILHHDSTALCSTGPNHYITAQDSALPSYTITWRDPTRRYDTPPHVTIPNLRITAPDLTKPSPDDTIPNLTSPLRNRTTLYYTWPYHTMTLRYNTIPSHDMTRHHYTDTLLHTI